MQQCLIHRRVASSQHIDRNEISLCHELGTPYRIISPNDWRMETDLFAKVAFRASPREVTGILDYLTGQLYKNGDSEIEIGFIYDTTSQLLLNVAKDSKSSNLSRAFKLSLMPIAENKINDALAQLTHQELSQLIKITFNTPKIVEGLKDAISAAIDDANHHLKTGGGAIQFSPSGKYFTDHQRRNLILDKLTTALIRPKPPSVLEKKTN